MKKIKLFLCIALFGAMSIGAYSAYDYITMSVADEAILENVDALTSGETPGGGDKKVPYACYTGKVNNTLTHITPNRYCGDCRMARLSEKTGDGECYLY